MRVQSIQIIFYVFNMLVIILEQDFDVFLATFNYKLFLLFQFSNYVFEAASHVREETFSLIFYENVPIFNPSALHFCFLNLLRYFYFSQRCLFCDERNAFLNVLDFVIGVPFAARGALDA